MKALQAENELLERFKTELARVYVVVLARGMDVPEAL